MPKFNIPEQRLQQISDRIGFEVSEIRGQIEKGGKENKDCEQRIRELQELCPHAVTKHHARLTAEDDDYDVCEICGATL